MEVISNLLECNNQNANEDNLMHYGHFGLQDSQKIIIENT
jgi:hypothetical protein